MEAAPLYVDEILKVPNLAIYLCATDEMTRFELTLNLMTAKTRGITMLQSTLLPAHEVIG